MKLKRKFTDFLLNWKSNHGKECLLVKGARQIGKTFTIDSFGRDNYATYLYINFRRTSPFAHTEKTIASSSMRLIPGFSSP